MARKAGKTLKVKRRAPKAAKASLAYGLERFRQTLHIMFGVIVALGAADFGRDVVLLGLVTFFAVFLTVINVEMIKHRTAFNIFFKKLERRVEIPGKGALMYVIGLMLLYSFSPNLPFAIGVTLMLAFGDGFATLVGRRGRRRIPWNKNKTLEGLVTFAATGFAAGAYFLGASAAIAYALVLALTESFNWGVDDNLAIPVAALLLWNLIPA